MSGGLIRFCVKLGYMALRYVLEIGIGIILKTPPVISGAVLRFSGSLFFCLFFRPATPVYHLQFSPDGLLFASAGQVL